MIGFVDVLVIIGLGIVVFMIGGFDVLVVIGLDIVVVTIGLVVLVFIISFEVLVVIIGFDVLVVIIGFDVLVVTIGFDIVAFAGLYVEVRVGIFEAIAFDLREGTEVRVITGREGTEVRVEGGQVVFVMVFATIVRVTIVRVVGQVSLVCGASVGADTAFAALTGIWGTVYTKSFG